MMKQHEVRLTQPVDQMLISDLSERGEEIDWSRPLYECQVCLGQGESNLHKYLDDCHYFDEDAYEDWRAWFARVKELNPKASGPEGWGACYGAGLSPESAVECCASGAGRETVESYWSGMHKYELKFDLAND